jgi:hypothetical protein
MTVEEDVAALQARVEALEARLAPEAAHRAKQDALIRALFKAKFNRDPTEEELPCPSE